MVVRVAAELAPSLIAAAEQPESRLRAELARFDPVEVATMFVAELADRTVVGEVTEPFVVRYEMTWDGGEFGRSVRVSGEGAMLVEDESAAASVRVRTDLPAATRALFGPEPTALPTGLGAMEGDPEHVAVLARCLSTVPDLAELALRHGSDKWGLHWYAWTYAKHFAPWRNKAVTIIEIGVGGYTAPNVGGGSLRMWQSYFPRGLVYGLDVFDKSGLDQQRIRTLRGNQHDEEFLDRVLELTGTPDIVVDDGSHINRDVIASFRHLFPKLRPGGLYVIEDTQTAYWPEYGGNSENPNDPATSIGFLKTLIDGLHHEDLRRKTPVEPSYVDSHVAELHFYHNMAVIRKRTEPLGFVGPAILD